MVAQWDARAETLTVWMSTQVTQHVRDSLAVALGLTGATITAAVTSTTPTGALRGFGMQEAAWVRERLVDEATRERRDALLGERSIASRSITVGGGALIRAAARLRERLGRIAAHRLEPTPETSRSWTASSGARSHRPRVPDSGRGRLTVPGGAGTCPKGSGLTWRRKTSTTRRTSPTPTRPTPPGSWRTWTPVKYGSRTTGWSTTPEHWSTR
ncbi:hypothetical protein [Microbispora sp. KK1-11]|uniref:hypothetical protein n=1 Tax=Microbispora sp. KK1-11 TaxID=2053005 RepID=UPI0021AFFA43|nr:hypothetical protein [Microbispora sp. KK1-11]